MSFAFVSVPAAPVRRKPDHRREMVNQLLFGETVRVLRERGKLWVKIRSLHDQYEGWMTRSLLSPAAKKEILEPAPAVVTDLFPELEWGGQRLHVPAGSTLPAFLSGKGQLAGLPYHFHGSFMIRGTVEPSASLVTSLANAWMGAPYLWGGRTPMGVDCSGFTQVIFKIMGISLPRDAWQQAKKGKEVKKFAEAQTGDLLFFDNSEDIVHVGIYLGEEKMIHASGKVKTDTVTKKGLINESDGSIQYGLSAIRRYW